MMWTFRRAGLAAGLLVAAAALGAGPVVAHSWYSSTGCCGGRDCKALEPGDVAFTLAEDGSDAWHVVATGEVIPADEVRVSPDGQNHRCVYLYGVNKGMTRHMGLEGAKRWCLWIAGGSY